MDESKETKSETKKEKNLEVKKEKDTKGNKWIIQTLAVISGILLILLISDAALGNGVFSWLNKSQTPEITPRAEGYNGLLAGKNGRVIFRKFLRDDHFRRKETLSRKLVIRLSELRSGV
jgi:hypothetical protein